MWCCNGVDIACVIKRVCISLPCVTSGVVVWHSGSALVLISKVNLHPAWLVLEWVIVSGFSSRCGTFISVCNQPPRSTQPNYPFVGRFNEYQTKGGMPYGWGVKAGMVRVWENCVIPLLHTGHI